MDQKLTSSIKTMEFVQPPLSEPWQRAAMKEVTDIAHLLCHGMIEDYQDFCDRLDVAANTIREMNAIGYEIKPSSRPEINALGLWRSVTWKPSTGSAIQRALHSPEIIHYEIIKGRCSHCGSEAESIEIPGGTVTWSDRCKFCDRENMETLADNLNESDS
jgi:hypothetical protein